MKKLLIACVFLGLVACGGKNEQAASSETNEQPTVAKETPKPDPTPAEETTAASKPLPGKGVYAQYCQVCHQASGEGLAGNYPPLAGTEWVTGDKSRLIGIILNGLEGEIEVNGEKYNNIMASHSYLTDKQIADVLTYIRQSWGNEASAVTPEEVAAEREKAGA